MRTKTASTPVSPSAPTGPYRIQAITFNAGVGHFTLTVREQAQPPKVEKK